MPIIVREMKQKILGGLVEEMNLELCQKMDEHKRKKNQDWERHSMPKSGQSHRHLNRVAREPPGLQSGCGAEWKMMDNLRRGQGWH